MRPFIFAVAVTLAAGIQVQPADAQGHDAQDAHTGHGGAATDHMQHSFADVERYAQSFDDPARDAWQMPDRVIEVLDLEPGQVVADIGAGTGYFSIRLARIPAAPKVLAADIESSMLEHIRQRAHAEGLGNVVPVQAAPGSANLPEPADVILIVDTYHHIGNRVAYFSSLRSQLKPGGRLAIIDFRQDSPEGPPAHFRFSQEQITQELAQAGYRLQAQHDFLPRQMYLIYGAD